MKKYIQIAAVVGIFVVLVVIRQMRGNDDAPVVGNRQQDTNVPQTVNNTSQNNSPAPTSTPTVNTSGKTYKDGTYTGPVTDAYYGNMQVQVTIAGGKISDVTFLQYPNDNPTTRQINNQAMPILKSEAIQAQSAQVDIVSGASQSSQAFQQSLSSALQQAS